jgi:hypothetical protein
MDWDGMAYSRAWIVIPIEKGIICIKSSDFESFESRSEIGSDGLASAAHASRNFSI